MVALTFPDGARRDYPQQHHRPRHRQRHFAVARQAHGGDGARRQARRSCRSDRARRQNRVPHPRRPARARTDPPRRRACARRSGADAVARHASHHRAGDRERLLLRLLPQRAVHAGGFRGHREKDARDHRARQTLHQGSVVARPRPSASFPTWANSSRSSWSTPSRKTKQIKIYKQGDWFDLCRGPHMTSTGKVGNAFKLMKVAGAYWRGDSKPRNALPHLRHRLRQAGGARRLSQADRGGGEARPPQARPRNGSVSFPGGSARLGVLASQRLDAVPDAGELHPPPPDGGRLCRGQRAAAHRFVALGRLRPHGDVSRCDVSDANRARRTSAPTWSSR